MKVEEVVDVGGKVGHDIVKERYVWLAPVGGGGMVQSRKSPGCVV